MNDQIDQVRQENERLKAALATQEVELARQVQLIGKLQHYLRGLLRGRYGRSTEKMLGDTPADQQLIAEVEAFLNEERAVTPTPAPAAVSTPAEVAPVVPPATEAPAAVAKRGRRQRPSLAFPQLEVRMRTADVPEAERFDANGQPMVACGSETVETVVFAAPEVFINRTIYPRYRSATVIDVAGRAETAGVPVPERIVERGMLDDTTVRQIVIGKFADALPCNRTLEILVRAGCQLSGSVVDGAVAAMGDLLVPLAAAIRDDLRTAAAVGVDAAMMRCRDGSLRRKCRRTPIYTVTDGTQAWYWWAPDETHARAPDVVAGFFRWMITDGWSGWRSAPSIGARLAGCWAHARRPFARSEDKDPDAAAMVRLIHEIYTIEDQATAAQASSEERRRLRDRLSRPVVERIRAFAHHLDAKHPGRNDGHPCGAGARYILNQWFDLVKFLDHPELRLDNNLAEGDLRMVALIRKNSLFLGAASAGPRFAACLSVLRSCRLARINPADYLAAVTPTLIEWRRCQRAKLPTPDLAELTPKRWADEHGQVISRAS